MRYISKKDWNATYAAHLINRAGFGAPPDEIEVLSRRDPHEIVEELIGYDGSKDTFPKPDWINSEGIDDSPRKMMMQMRNADPDAKREKRKEENRKNRKYLMELYAWWLYRMRYTEKPLQEKLTLFWHGHFATSAQKVKLAYSIYLQNETLRQHSNGNWEELLLAISKDPAMLRYLDNAQNNRRKPNENYARELMELFSLGEGHYTEEDIRESARSFTGWTIDRDKIAFANSSRLHDSGSKTFMGIQGDFNGEDIIRIILEQKEAPRYISRKLWEYFAYENPEKEIENHLEQTLRKNNYELRPLLKEIFTSKAFYSEKAIRKQIKSPVQWLIQFLKTLEARMPPPKVSHTMTANLGQELFRPPNVKGWDGGTSWITTANLLNRYNYAGALVKGMHKKVQYGMIPRGAGGLNINVNSLLPTEKVLPEIYRESREKTQTYLFNRLFQSQLRKKERIAFMTYLKEQAPPKEWKKQDLAEAIHLLMSTPQYQLT